MSDGRHLINQNVVVVITNDRRSTENKVFVICDLRELKKCDAKESVIWWRRRTAVIHQSRIKDLITHDEEEA